MRTAADRAAVVIVREKVMASDSVGDVLGSTHIPRRRRSLVLVQLILIFGICG
jgi:hypothetical protein